MGIPTSTRISKGAQRRAEKAAIHKQIATEVAHNRTTKKDNPIITNRMETRAKNKKSGAEAMHTVKRAQRFTKLKDEAKKIKKKFRKNFKKQERWREIEIEVQKILGRKGESNITEPKKKR